MPNNMTLTGLNGNKIEAKNLKAKKFYSSTCAAGAATHLSMKDCNLFMKSTKAKDWLSWVFRAISLVVKSRVQQPNSNLLQGKHGVTFPLLEKQDVKARTVRSLYQSLVSSDKGGGKNVRWNFEKLSRGQRWKCRRAIWLRRQAKFNRIENSN